MSKVQDDNIYFEGSPVETTPLPYQDTSFNPDRFKGGASNFLKGFMTGRGMPLGTDDDEDEGFKLPETSPATDFLAGSRGNKYATQSRTNALNIASQDFGRGVQQGKFYEDFSLDKFTPTADFSIKDELKTRQIDYTKANTNLSADQGVTSTVVNHDDHTTSIADEIDKRQSDAYTKATANDADAINTGEGTEFAIFSQTDDPNLNETINTNLPTDADIETLENFQINTLNSATKDDPALKDDFGNADTSGLAIYQDDEDTGINVSDRLTENNIDIEASQYRGTGNEIDINATGAVDEELRTRREDAYGEAVENDPWDGVYNPEGLSGDYDPQANLDNYNLITPTVDNQPINTTSPTPDPTPGDDLGIGNEADQRGEETRVTRDSNSGTQHPDGHTGVPDEPVYNQPTPIQMDEAPVQDNVSNAINLMRDGDDRGAWNMLRRTVGLEEGTDDEWNAELANRAERDRIAAERQARNSETAGRSQTLDMNTMQPIGRQGVVNDETTNVQQEGSSASAEIDVEAETRDNQLALQSNEAVASGGADTALMQQPEPAQPEWQSQGFKDEAQFDRFNTGYAEHTAALKALGRTITDDTKSKYKERFFDTFEPAYEYDQKAKAHNAVINEAKQRGVDTGVFKNIGEVNNWINRLNRKQAGKYVGYSDQNKENFLTENKLDTMRYM